LDQPIHAGAFCRFHLETIALHSELNRSLVFADTVSERSHSAHLAGLAELDEAIFEYAHLVADLMAVDGALVLTAARDIIGFGAEIHMPTRENEIV
jgi:hypothetical protein